MPKHSSVPLYLNLLGKSLDGQQRALKMLGNLETKLLTYDIIDIPIKSPIFITGLARSGTTLLLEILNKSRGIAAHQYQDYPFLHMIYFWGQFNKYLPHPQEKTERAHQDRIKVNAQSPEALDEILWQSFFDKLHDPSQPNLLTPATPNPAFDAFYTAHIKKLLILRKGQRFISKNNYNITRIAYLRALFPDAKFIIPLRRAEDHIASLMKQHKLISAAQKADPAAANYMRRHGHFEFGLDFRPVNAGDTQSTEQISQLWAKGQHIEAYAHYWNTLHHFIAENLHAAPDLQNHIHFVRYDELCTDPAGELHKLLTFCAMDEPNLITEYKNAISAPRYYEKTFSAAQQDMIKSITGKTESNLWNT